MSHENVLYLLSRERYLSAVEKLIVFSAWFDSTLLGKTSLQIANELHVSESAVTKAMPRLKAMNMLKRDLNSKSLILSSPEAWKLKPRE
jgi:hypothetical protein